MAPTSHLNFPNASLAIDIAFSLEDVISSSRAFVASSNWGTDSRKVFLTSADPE